METENIHKSYHINSFDEGDVITRVERAPFIVEHYNDNLGISVQVTKHTDGSYMGDRMEYIGIFNRMICCKSYFLGKERIVKLHYDQWQNGWQKYCIPEL